jgi:hypothetical protein
VEFPWILSFQKKNVTNSEKSVNICTDKKEKKIFLIYGNLDGTGCKVIYEEALPNI